MKPLRMSTVESSSTPPAQRNGHHSTLQSCNERSDGPSDYGKRYPICVGHSGAADVSRLPRVGQAFRTSTAVLHVVPTPTQPRKFPTELGSYKGMQSRERENRCLT